MKIKNMKQYLVKILIIMFLFTNISYANSNQDTGQKIADALAYPILKLAWPTAIYDTCSFQNIDFNRKGNIEVSFKIYAKSYWTGGSLWLETIVELNKDYDIEDISWGDYKSVWPPGSTIKVLKGLNK